MINTPESTHPLRPKSKKANAPSQGTTNGNVDGVWKSWSKIFGERLIEAPGTEKQGGRAQRGRGAATITGATQQPKMPSPLDSTDTNGAKEVTKLEEVRKLGDHPKHMQSSLRQLQFLYYSVKRNKGHSYGGTADHLTDRLQKTYNAYGGTTNAQVPDAYKARFAPKPVFLLRLRGELDERPKAADNATLKTRRGAQSAANEAFADKKQGMRRTHAAARKPLQQLLIPTKHTDKLCYTPDDIDEACGHSLGHVHLGKRRMQPETSQSLFFRTIP